VSGELVAQGRARLRIPAKPPGYTEVMPPVVLI